MARSAEVLSEDPKPKLSIHDRVSKEVKTDTDKLSIALWFIKKCGSLESAERVFRAAVSATRELEK